jgi:hypothetical protein
MRGFVHPLRFFGVVPPVPRIMVATFAVATTLSVITVAIHPSRAAGALAPVLLLQLFAASSGFALPARRGYYDLLLTHGDGRWRIALTHWLFSVAPGIASWLIIAAAEALGGGGGRLALLASGTCAAMCLLSTLPWAITVTLPRFAGAVGWLLVLVMAATMLSGAEQEAWLTSTYEQSGMQPALVFLLYPAVAVGRELSPRDIWVIAPALVVATCGMLAAARWIVRAEFPLEAAQ